MGRDNIKKVKTYMSKGNVLYSPGNPFMHKGELWFENPINPDYVFCARTPVFEEKLGVQISALIPFKVLEPVEDTPFDEIPHFEFFVNDIQDRVDQQNNYYMLAMESADEAKKAIEYYEGWLTDVV